jgi:hypothetical protein
MTGRCLAMLDFSATAGGAILPFNSMADLAPLPN